MIFHSVFCIPSFVASSAEARNLRKNLMKDVLQFLWGPNSKETQGFPVKSYGLEFKKLRNFKKNRTLKLIYLEILPGGESSPRGFLICLEVLLGGESGPGGGESSPGASPTCLANLPGRRIWAGSRIWPQRMSR